MKNSLRQASSYGILRFPTFSTVVKVRRNEVKNQEITRSLNMSRNKITEMLMRCRQPCHRKVLQRVRQSTSR